MASSRRRTDFLPHLVLVLGVAIFAFPIYFAVIGSTWDASTIGRGQMPLFPGPLAAENYWTVWSSGEGTRIRSTPVATLMFNSLVMALVICFGKIAISLLSAYAVVFFWMIFVTLMLPVEVRIIPTYEVIVNLGMFDSFAGLTVPLIASATATLLFRQFFLTIPDELVEASKIDGAGPLRFFWDTVLPLSRTNIAALAVILFIYGWNQYLWPLLITKSKSMETIIIGITKMIGTGEVQNDWNLIMATTIFAMLPPVLVVVFMQRWFVKGLVDTEK